MLDIINLEVDYWWDSEVDYWKNWWMTSLPKMGFSWFY